MDRQLWNLHQYRRAKVTKKTVLWPHEIFVGGLYNETGSNPILEENDILNGEFREICLARGDRL
jgi:hypothetical protein